MPETFRHRVSACSSLLKVIAISLRVTGKYLAVVAAVTNLCPSFSFTSKNKPSHKSKKFFSGDGPHRRVRRFFFYVTSIKSPVPYAAQGGTMALVDVVLFVGFLVTLWWGFKLFGRKKEESSNGKSEYM